MDLFCIYLRKSRADAEAEASGEGDTLARHEKALLSLAERLHLPVMEIYREVVSGETIAARPMMQRLLAEVEQGVWNGVLVMEVERLARGDTIDQGIVAQTFKYSGTKIITPLKTYDPLNEFDEEYFEFGLFMSRREYKTINRRLQQGRLASIKEGKYVANSPPYGYLRKKIPDGKGYTLEPHPEQSPVVSIIFSLYTDGEPQPDGTRKRLGASLIARRLNEVGIPPRKCGAWSASSIRDILKNPVYIGKLRWKWRPVVKKMVSGRVVTARPRVNAETGMVVDGLHQAIIDEAVFKAAQTYRKQSPPLPVAARNSVKNPLGGLVICGRCGRRMIRRPYPKSRGQPDTLMCPDSACGNVSTALRLVEERLLEALSDWLEVYELDFSAAGAFPFPDPAEEIKKTLQKRKTALFTLEKQHSRLCSLLEQGIYSNELYLERSRQLNERISATRQEIQDLSVNPGLSPSVYDCCRNNVPAPMQLCDVYWKLPTAAAKNDFLKQLLEKVIYIKEINGRWHHDPDEFELMLFPRLPREKPPFSPDA